MPRVPVGSGLSVEPLGVFAQHGETVIDADIGRGILGVEGTSPTEIATGFHQLMEVLNDEFNIDTRKNTWFIENINELNVQGSRNALDSIKHFDTDSPLVNITNKVLGEPTAYFGLRIGSKQTSPIDPDWFDLRIEPLLRNLSVYWVNIVYRSPEEDKVLRLLEDIDKNVQLVISNIESSADEKREPKDRQLIRSKASNVA